MSGEGSNERVSRARALRLVAFGAAGAAGMMLAEAPAADAAVDSSYIAQNNGSSDLGTGYITITGSGGHGYSTGGQFAGSSVGVYGSSATANGVIGTSAGDPGELGAAIRAFNTGKGDGVWASASVAGGRGVYGENFADGDGVYGVSDGAGAGVHGVGNGGPAVQAEDTSDAGAYGVLATSIAGTAVAAEATNPAGTALLVRGRAVFSNCGIATVPGSVATPRQAVNVNNVALTTNSLVVATLQANIAGVFVASAVPHATTGTVTINLNQPVSQHIKVGWFVCDLLPPV
jgi:hypothetical protein